MANNFVDYSNATELMTEIGNKIKALNGAYILRGSVTFANLPGTLTAAMTGYVYNVSNEFTTDARFIEGAGKKYSAGTNVVVANVGTAETPNMKFDVISAFVDVDGINTRINNVRNTLADVFDTTSAYAIGDVVIYEDGLYRFTTAHTAGDWDSTQVETVTVETLIDEAEPESLTSSQITALISLLD